MNQERITATQTTAARWVKKQGGNRIAQETAAIYAKALLNEGKSAATAIEQSVKAGMETANRCNTILQA